MKKLLFLIVFLSIFASCATYLPPGQEIGRDGYFVAYDSGVVKDARTGLEWLAGPDKDTTWYDAKSWIESLNKDDFVGGGWRMPNRKELMNLYKKGAGPRNMTALLKTSGWWVWMKQTAGASSAYYWSFGGGEGKAPRNHFYSTRAFAVRSRR